MVEILPHLDAALNITAGTLLFAGWRFVRHKRIPQHRACMVAAFACSVVFLVCYLTRYALAGNHVYEGPGRELYLVLLGTHVLLAACVPFLALRTIYLAIRGPVSQHRRWARVTFPIWMYVSVTGVCVYWILYH